MHNPVRIAPGHFRRCAFSFSSLLALLLAGSAVAETSVKIDPEVLMKQGFVATEGFEGVWQRTLPDTALEYKVIKDGDWAVKRRSVDGSEVVVYQGGTYVVAGDVFIETVDFVESGDTNLVGKAFVYRLSFEDDLLRQTSVEESAVSTEWSRVEVVAEAAPRKEFSMESIAIINVKSASGSSAGSGFVAEMDGKKYLVTNQHVLDCMGTIEITTMDNVQIRPVGFEISRKLDLVRLEITNDIPALAMRRELPAIGDAVMVYGNSAGGGVATELKGKVLGVGPDLIEVDAQFVEGNSGCPMLNANSEVLGVASYATLYQDPGNLMSKDSRFQEIRRYGIRLKTEDWVAVSPKIFQEQAQELSDRENAVFMYAITYLSFRNFTSEPRIYAEQPTRLDEENYQRKFTEWKSLVNTFNSVKPDSKSFYSAELSRRCSTHYEKATKLFNRPVFDRALARSGRLPINLDSIYNLKSMQEQLKQQRYCSQHLLDKSEKLVSICEYVLGVHERE